MGQAKLRGTFEERKAQAIAAGRIKRRFYKPNRILPPQISLVEFLSAIFKNR